MRHISMVHVALVLCPIAIVLVICDIYQFIRWLIYPYKLMRDIKQGLLEEAWIRVPIDSSQENQHKNEASFEDI